MPLDRSSTSASRSRFLFRRIFALQKADLVRGIWPHLRQPCQKHPSTNIASLSSEKKKSGLPGRYSSCMVQPRIPDRTRAKRNLISVVLFPEPLTADIVLERRVDTPLNFPPGSLARRLRSTVKYPYRRTRSLRWPSRPSLPYQPHLVSTTASYS